MTGTLLNVLTVLIGSALGILLGARFPDRIRETIMGVIGIMVLVIGVSMAITGNALVVLGSLLVGGILGELLEIENRLNALGRVLEARFAGKGTEGKFTKGFVTASLVFCVGPMTILGSIQDGLIGDFRLLAIKSVLDGFASLAFASTLGVGVAFSAAIVLLFQGGISAAAMSLGTVLGTVTRDAPWVIQLSATGGAILIGLGLVLLDLKRLRVANLLPAIVIAPLLQIALQLLQIRLP